MENKNAEQTSCDPGENYCTARIMYHPSSWQHVESFPKHESFYRDDAADPPRHAIGPAIVGLLVLESLAILLLLV